MDRRQLCWLLEGIERQQESDAVARKPRSHRAAVRLYRLRSKSNRRAGRKAPSSRVNAFGAARDSSRRNRYAETAHQAGPSRRFSGREVCRPCFAIWRKISLNENQPGKTSRAGGIARLPDV